MTELRRRMDDDMVARGFAERTRESYLWAVTGLARFYRRSPDRISDEEVQAYLVHLLRERQRSWSTCNVVANGLRFFYHTTLKRDRTTFVIPAPRQRQKLPAILSREEVEQARFLLGPTLAVGSGNLGGIGNVPIAVALKDSGKLVVHGGSSLLQYRRRPGNWRLFVTRTVFRLLLLPITVVVVLGSVRSHGQAPKTFSVWVFADAHVGTDKGRGRESLADALRQSESAAGFEWDIALDLGDMSGAQGTPKDLEGEEIVRQFGALKQHRREDVYDLSGNHDRSGLDEPQAWWWRKWLDPTGEHTEFSQVDARKRRFPIDGTWERYSFRVGNLLFLMMSDINEPTQTVGRGTLGGNPGGVVSGETFRWWKRMVEENRSSIIVSAHHYVLKDTTVASGEWEGMQRDEQGAWRGRYHGYFAQGTPQGASYLYWVDSKRDSGVFENVLAAAPMRDDLWLGAHTHTDPDDTYGGKSHVEKRWATTFINVSGLTRYHSAPQNSIPRSWLLTFTDGSDELIARCYLHGNEHAPQGWYGKVERLLKLSKPFTIPRTPRG